MKFPDWLPPAVAREARYLATWKKRRVLLIRLTTDERMQSVWRVLKQAAQQRSAAMLRKLLRDHGMAPGETDVDRALRAVLLCAFYYAGPNTINIVSKHQAIINSYEKHANLLCDAARTLRELDKRYLDDPSKGACRRNRARGRLVQAANSFAEGDVHRSRHTYDRARLRPSTRNGIYADVLVRETAFSTAPFAWNCSEDRNCRVRVEIRNNCPPRP